jgi:ketosteroid isomerase-like protein
VSELATRNEDLVRRLFDAHNRGPDFLLASLEQIFHPEIVWTPAIIGGLEGGSYQGYDGIRRYYADREDAFEGGQVDVLECEHVGDSQMVAHVLSTGVGRASGARLEQELWMLAGIRDGRLVRWHAFTSRGEAIEAATSS